MDDVSITCSKCGKRNFGMRELPRFCTFCGVDMEKAWLAKPKVKEEFAGKKCRKCGRFFERPQAVFLYEYCPACGGKLKTVNRPAVPEMNPWYAWRPSRSVR